MAVACVKVPSEISAPYSSVCNIHVLCFRNNDLGSTQELFESGRCQTSALVREPRPACLLQRKAGQHGTQAEDGIMVPRLSGKVSGILDDLSDAMSMLKDLLPSAHSELHMQVRLQRNCWTACLNKD